MGPKLKAWFDIQPECRPCVKRAEWAEFSADWYYWIKFPGKDPRRVWIAKNYYYNGASIPWAARPIVGDPFRTVYWAGAGAHDEGYLTHRFPRDIMDEIFHQLVHQSNRELKIGMWDSTIDLEWTMLRTFGYPAWVNSRQDKKDLVEYAKMIALRPDAEKFDLGIAA